MQYTADNTRLAFSLIELSIVLVILGLLVGGVLSGRVLIRNSELRSVSVEFEQFVSATHAFKDKYFYLPGDMPNATSFWGALDPTPTACTIIRSTSSLTCNGNGDGFVLLTASSQEPLRFWQHLANAELIKGAYAGSSFGPSGPLPLAPTGKINNSIWAVNYVATALGGVYTFFDGTYDHYIDFGSSSAGIPLTPGEAFQIDTKMDDGKPGLGKVVGYGNAGGWGLEECTNAIDTTTINADYFVSSNEPACGLRFRRLF